VKPGDGPRRLLIAGLDARKKLVEVRKIEVGARRRLAGSRFAGVAALPERLGAVMKHNFLVSQQSVSWLIRSREHTNYTYDLTELNLLHLAWFVSVITGISVGEARIYINELEQDEGLRERALNALSQSPRRRLADPEIRWHKRLGWYALVRALAPNHVVETGTDKGLGTLALAAAVQRNGRGRVTTIDSNPASGSLICEPYASVVDRLVVDSADLALRELATVDFFLHDSARCRSQEELELLAVEPRLGPSSTVLSNTGDISGGLPLWAEATGRKFLFFQERPREHWYPGGGIAAAWSG
jgi:hypothetical protein